MEHTVSKVRVAAFSVSLDGFGVGPRQDVNNPLGVRGFELHAWFQETKYLGRCTVKAVVLKASITTLPFGLLRMLVLGSYAALSFHISQLGRDFPIAHRKNVYTAQAPRLSVARFVVDPANHRAIRADN